MSKVMSQLFALLLLAFVIIFVWAFTSEGRVEELFSKMKPSKGSKEPKEKEPKEKQSKEKKPAGGHPSQGHPAEQNCAPCANNQTCYMNTVIKLSENQGDCLYACDSCSVQSKKLCQNQCQQSFRY